MDTFYRAAQKRFDEGTSQIQSFYAGKAVLITGVTGFLGKLLLVKLLLSCPDVRRIYILVREKNGRQVEERLQGLLREEIFQRLSTDLLKKIRPVRGDLTEPGLGLASLDRAAILDEVSIVFHCAATINFEERLQAAVAINMVGTRSVCKLAERMQSIQALIYVSTAFSNCQNKEINEKVYPPDIDPDIIIGLVNSSVKLDEKRIRILLNKQPNTYVYTKCMAEAIVYKFARAVPAAIFRPAIVTATAAEPEPGWLTNKVGVNGVIAAVSCGIMKTMHCRPKAAANIVPADLTVNAVIALGYCVGTRRQSALLGESAVIASRLPVVNYVQSSGNTLTWGGFNSYMQQNIIRYPPKTLYWYPRLYITRNSLLAKLQKFIMQTLPALLIALSTRHDKGNRTSKFFRSISNLQKQLEYFTMGEWNFEQSNMRALWELMNDADRKTFPFDMDTIHWPSYFSTYIRGVRKYILSDDMVTLLDAKVKLQRWHHIHLLLLVFLSLFVCWICSYLLPTLLI